MRKEKSFRVGIGNLLRLSAELVSNLNIVAVGYCLYAPLREEKCANRAEVDSFYISPACTKEETNQRKAVRESGREPLRSSAPQRWLRRNAKRASNLEPCVVRDRLHLKRDASGVRKGSLTVVLEAARRK